MFKNSFDYFSWCTEMVEEAGLDIGFKLFGLEHILWNVVMGIMIILVAWFYKKADINKRKIYRYVVAGLLVLDEIIKIICLVYNGRYSVSYLPLHLCSIGIFISLWHSLKPNKFNFELIYCLQIPGAVIAMLMPTWTCLPFLNLMSIHSFTVHALLILYGVLLLVGKEQKHTLKGFIGAVAFILIYAIPIAIINTKFNTNFLFINHTNENPFLILLEGIFKYHQIGILLSVAILWSIMYMPFYIKKGKKNSNVN